MFTSTQLEELGRQSCVTCSGCENCCTPKNVTEETCICPSDRIGATCSTFRPFSCTFNESLPAQTCSENGCTESDTLNLNYYMTCVQSGNFTIDESFAYEVRDGNKVPI